MQTHLGLRSLELAISIGVLAGVVVWLSALFCAFSFRAWRTSSRVIEGKWPAVTLLKPVYGLEKHLLRNLRSACTQDYPEYQVVLSVQRTDDPAIPVLRDLLREFGTERVTLAIESVVVGMNGKVNNLAGALRHARHDILVISDSDVWLSSDFLKQMVAPLDHDPTVGATTSFFRAVDADHWFERLELLGLNADQFAMAILARATGAVDFCFGVSTALRKQTLNEIGGFEALGASLVEDTEMGHRIGALGKRVLAVPHVVDVTIDLASASAWAQKQIYWEQNTLAAVPGLFAAGLLLRIIPLSLLFAALRGWDSFGLTIALAALAVRLASAAIVLGVALRDREGLRALWLLPLKDLLSPCWAIAALTKRTVTWRGVELLVGSGGRLSDVAVPTSSARDGGT